VDTTFDHNNNNYNNENNVSIIIAYECQPNLLGWPTDLWDYPLGARTQLCNFDPATHQYVMMYHLTPLDETPPLPKQCLNLQYHHSLFHGRNAVPT
jgi:hypothetical protein